MKTIFVIGGVVAVVVIGLMFINPDSDTSVPAQNTADLAEIQSDLDSGAVLVDVRTPQEYASGHAVGAINVPLQDIQQGDYGPLSQDDKLYVYCRSGNRSAQAISLLNDAGYTNTVDLISLTNWQSLGGEITTD